MALRFIVDLSQAKPWPMNLTDQLRRFVQYPNESSTPIYVDPAGDAPDVPVPGDPFTLDVATGNEVLILSGSVRKHHGNCTIIVPKDKEDGIHSARLYDFSVLVHDDYFGDFLLLAKEFARFGVTFRNLDGKPLELECRRDKAVREIRDRFGLVLSGAEPWMRSFQVKLIEALEAAYEAGLAAGRGSGEYRA